MRVDKPTNYHYSTGTWRAAYGKRLEGFYSINYPCALNRLP